MQYWRNGRMTDGQTDGHIAHVRTQSRTEAR